MAGLEFDESPSSSHPCATEAATLLRQGAEAKLYTTLYFGKPCIVKERFAKAYRHKALDDRLTLERQRAECRALVRCRQLGIKVPAIYFVDTVKHLIGMEHLTNACTLREYIDRHHVPDQATDDQPPPQLDERVRHVAEVLGQTLSKMHQNNVIHGDLTTSNVLVVNGENGSPPELVMIDFGLCYVESVAEDKGVDLYVMERALISAHPGSQPIFDQIIESYKQAHPKQANSVIKKLDEVRARGRKRDMIG